MTLLRMAPRRGGVPYCHWGGGPYARVNTVAGVPSPPNLECTRLIGGFPTNTGTRPRMRRRAAGPSLVVPPPPPSRPPASANTPSLPPNTPRCSGGSDGGFRSREGR